MKPLSAQQRRFIDEYLVDFNGKQAAIRAGYSERSAKVTASRMLTQANVKKAIAEGRRRLVVSSSGNDIMADRVIQELAKIAFADIRKVVTWRSNSVGMRENPDTGEMEIVGTNDVTLVNSEDLPPEVAAAISEVSMTATGALKVKLYDKRAALVDLGRHLNIFQRPAPGEKADASGVTPRETDDPDSFDGLLN